MYRYLLFLLFSENCRPFVCSICKKAYKHKSSLVTHIKYECGKDPNLTCPVEGCSYVSKLEGNLKAHLKRKHFITS